MPTRWRVRCVCAALALLAGTAAGVRADDPPSTARRVLLLHQELSSRPFRARFNTAFVDALRAGGEAPSVDLDEETIEADRFAGPNRSQVFKDYLKAKYSDRRLDAVVAVGSVALAYARENRALFGDPPIVSVGTTSPRLGAADNTVGLQGGTWIPESINLALTLRPGASTLFVVDGSRTNRMDIEEDVRRQLADCGADLHLAYLRDLPLDELRSRLIAAPPESVVFFVRQTMRTRSEDLDPLEGLLQVVAASPVPVLATMDEFLGRGIVGGYMWDFESDARRMAGMVRRIEDGGSARDLPTGSITSAPRFDWRQLQRWGIPESRLPAGSVVLFRQPSFWQSNRLYVMGGAAVFAAQALLIVGLLFQRGRRRRAETRHAALLRAIPDLMFVLGADGTYLDYHARDPKLLAAPPSTFLGRTIREILPPRLSDEIMSAIAKALQSEEPVVVEYELTIGGEPLLFEARIVACGRDKVVSIVRDLTETARAKSRSHDLAGRLIASQEVERSRIARELHDDFSQRVALLNIEIDQLSAGRRGTLDGGERLTRLAAQAAALATDVHHLARRLHPSKLQTLGLEAALRSLCTEFSDQHQVRVAFTHEPLPPGIDPDVSLCLYRITQEALQNVVRHSGARTATVELRCDGRLMSLQIADEGAGFDPASTDGAGLGLVSMRERVAYLGGTLQIRSAPGKGTRVVVVVPLVASASGRSREIA